MRQNGRPSRGKNAPGDLIHCRETGRGGVQDRESGRNSALFPLDRRRKRWFVKRWFVPIHSRKSVPIIDGARSHA